jgi:hypothetical protein
VGTGGKSTPSSHLTMRCHGPRHIDSPPEFSQRRRWTATMRRDAAGAYVAARIISTSRTARLPPAFVAIRHIRACATTATSATSSCGRITMPTGGRSTGFCVTCGSRAARLTPHSGRSPARARSNTRRHRVAFSCFSACARCSSLISPASLPSRFHRIPPAAIAAM